MFPSLPDIPKRQRLLMLVPIELLLLLVPTVSPQLPPSCKIQADEPYLLRNINSFT